jgi:hypothetical protein
MPKTNFSSYIYAPPTDATHACFIYDELRDAVKANAPSITSALIAKLVDSMKSDADLNLQDASRIMMRRLQFIDAVAQHRPHLLRRREVKVGVAQILGQVSGKHGHNAMCQIWARIVTQRVPMERKRPVRRQVVKTVTPAGIETQPLAAPVAAPEPALV